MAMPIPAIKAPIIPGVPAAIVKICWYVEAAWSGEMDAVVVWAANAIGARNRAKPIVFGAIFINPPLLPNKLTTKEEYIDINK